MEGDARPGDQVGLKTEGDGEPTLSVPEDDLFLIKHRSLIQPQMAELLFEIHEWMLPESKGYRHFQQTSHR
jgi:hypothetical protein